MHLSLKSNCDFLQLIHLSDLNSLYHHSLNIETVCYRRKNLGCGVQHTWILILAQSYELFILGLALPFYTSSSPFENELMSSQSTDKDQT